MSHHGFFSQPSTVAAHDLSPTTGLDPDMMLHDWLGRTILHDLELASLWKDIGIDANGFLDANSFSQIRPSLKDEIEHVRVRHDNGDFEEDEDRLAIVRSASRPDQWPVQLLNFTKKSAPVQARLSDGTTFVYAKFKAQCLQAFHRKHARNFTDSGEGSMLRVKAFKILATAHGSPHDRVTLLITDFESNGDWHVSKQSVGNPSALHKSPGIEHRLHKLLGLELPKAASQTSSPERGSKSVAIDHGQSPTEGGDAAFSPASVISQVHQASMTPAQFVTQLPPHRSSAMVDLAPNFNIMTFIAKRPPQSYTPEQGVTSPTLASPQPNASGRTGIIQTGQRVSPSGQQPQSLVIEPTLDLNVDEEPSQYATRNTSQEPHAPQQQVEDGAEAHAAIETAAAPPARQSFAVTEENTPKITSTPRGRHIFRGLADNDPLESGVQQPVEKPGTAANGPWASMKFPLPDLSVPKEQQAILKESHSWYPAAPGRSFPAGNVPQAVLQWAEAQGRIIIKKREEAAASMVIAPGFSTAAEADNQSIKTTSTGSDKEDCPDGTALSWSGSESGDRNEEDDSRSSVDFIDPTPTMPSPLKASPVKKRLGMLLPPDSSESSPQRPEVHRIAEPQDSDDEMIDFEVPHTKAENDARTEGLTVDTKSESARDPDAERVAARSPPVVQYEESSPCVPAEKETIFQAGPALSDQPDFESSDEPNSSPLDADEDEPHLGPLLKIPLMLEPDLQLPPDSPSVSQMGGSSVHQVPTKKVTADDESSHPIEQGHSAIPTTSAYERRKDMCMSSPEPLALSSLRGQSRTSASASTSPPARSVHRTPYNSKVDQSYAQPLGEPISFVQSTYPERSAQKRKADVEDLSDSSPKHIKQGKSRYEFSQDTPPPVDYRKQNQRDKREFLKQRRHERAPTPEAERALRRGDISEEAKEPGSGEEAPNPIAVHIDVENDRQSATHADAEMRNVPKRKLPWQPSEASNSTPRPEAPQRQPPSSASGTPQCLAGWRQRSIERLASSARNSPEPAPGTPQRLAGWRRRSIEHLVSSARSSPQPPSSSGTTDQQRSRLLSSGSGTLPAPIAPQRTSMGFIAPPLVTALSARATGYLMHPPRKSLDAEGSIRPTGDASTPQSTIDGPVKSFHADWKNLKSVRRHLCDSEDELRQRHPKTWNVNGWKV